MSNVKRVEIKGEVPFDFCEFNTFTRRGAINNWLATMNLPSVGIKIKYGQDRFIKNQDGGDVCMYEFTISGEEAFGWGALKALAHELRLIGSVEVARARDIEEDTGWVEL